MSLQAFEIAIPQPTLDDLAARLDRTRFEPPLPGDASHGLRPAYLRTLVGYWRERFDWRAQEAKLNGFKQFRADVGGQRVHFIHQRGRGEAPLPLLLTHGFPDSFARFVKLIPLLTDPASHGGDASDAFDVVVPSLPGNAFSDASPHGGGLFGIHDLWHTLMNQVLEYRRYGAHGGDWGSIITEQLARSHGSELLGIHLTDVPYWHTFQKPSTTTDAERRYLAAIEQFTMKEGAYAMIQGTRPRTLADSLNDSPAGLAAWLVEKFQRWSDCDGDVEQRFTKDELLTNVMLYWATESVESSFQPYFDVTHAGLARWILEKAKEWVGSSKVPAGFAMFPKDLSHPPREWAERFFQVKRWTQMPRGGHFAALEEPQLLAKDLREFFRPLRQG